MLDFYPQLKDIANRIPNTGAFRSHSFPKPTYVAVKFSILQSAGIVHLLLHGGVGCVVYIKPNFSLFYSIRKRLTQRSSHLSL